MWREETSAASRNVWLGLIATLGIVLAVACRPGTTDGDGNRVAAFWLGVFLVVLAIVGVAAGGHASVTVDVRQGLIVSERRSVLGSRTVTVRFDEVERVSVQTLAGHNGMPAYHVVVRRRDGGRVPLYVGFFSGQFSRAAMQARCRRIESALAARGQA